MPCRQTQPGRRERFWYPYLLIAPTMFTLILVSLIPFVYTVYLSFHAAKFGRVTGFIGFDNYLHLLTSPLLEFDRRRVGLCLYRGTH